MQIFGTVETFANPSQVLNIPNYNTIRVDRRIVRGGGIAVIIEKSLKFKVIKQINDPVNHFQVITISIENILFTAIYNPPQNTFTY